jgi:hypothetical protein
MGRAQHGIKWAMGQIAEGRRVTGAWGREVVWCDSKRGIVSRVGPHGDVGPWIPAPTLDVECRSWRLAEDNE